VADAIPELRHGIESLKGTEQEMLLVRELLWLLKLGRHDHEWLDVYLKTLYEHPTAEVVSALADHAAVLAETVGRVSEVQAAFKHIRDIPFSFTGKERFGSAFAEANHNDPIQGLK
jgi:hypothetical protein